MKNCPRCNATHEALRVLKPRSQVTEPLHSYKVTRAVKRMNPKLDLGM